MATVTAIERDRFKARFPEFASLADAVIDNALCQAINYLNPNTWGACYDEAVDYWAAHWLALSQARIAQSGSSGSGVVGGGTLQSASVGGVSISYAVPQFATAGGHDEAYFSQTPYGQYYLVLRDSCISGGMLAGTQPVDVC